MIWEWQLAVSGWSGFSCSYGRNEFSVSRLVAFSLLFRLRTVIAPARLPIANDTTIASASNSVMAVFLEKRLFCAVCDGLFQQTLQTLCGTAHAEFLVGKGNIL
ncbi:MAG: hypothetical protein M3A44_02670 [Gammaproteobacteria bacterium]